MAAKYLVELIEVLCTTSEEVLFSHSLNNTKGLTHSTGGGAFTCLTLMDGPYVGISQVHLVSWKV